MRSWKQVLVALALVGSAGLGLADEPVAARMAYQRAAVEAAKQTSVPWLPADAQINRMPEQEFLRPHGLYLDQLGLTRRLAKPDQLGCRGLELQAHRGHPLYPENSDSAVTHAFGARFNAAEVDARQLRDDYWVFNHDNTLNRTVSNGSRTSKVGQLKREEWFQGFMRDRSGLITQEQAQDSIMTMMNAAAYRQPGQRINIEIKAGDACKELGTLNMLATTLLTPQGVSYSSLNDMRPLACLRSVNSDAYMALIEGPSRQALEDWAKANHGTELAKLTGRRQLMAASNFVSEAFGAYKFPPWNSAQGLAKIRSVLGSNAGIHVEIQRLLADPAIVRRAHAAGLKVMSYSINDNQSHLNGLRSLKAKGLLPDGAIVDSTPINTCTALGLE